MAVRLWMEANGFRKIFRGASGISYHGRHQEGGGTIILSFDYGTHFYCVEWLILDCEEDVDCISYLEIGLVSGSQCIPPEHLNALS